MQVHPEIWTSGQMTPYDMSSTSSTYRKTRLPAIPPIPPNPTSVALQKALFHCPRMLFAWYVIHCGIFELHPAVVRKTPKYFTSRLPAHPIRERPMMHRSALKTINGPRMWYCLTLASRIEAPMFGSNLVTNPGCGEHHNAGKRIRGCNKALRSTDAKVQTCIESKRRRMGKIHSTTTFIEYDWHEVSQSVSDSSRAAKNQRKAPCFEVQRWFQKLSEIEWLQCNVCPISVHPRDDEIDFTLVEESPGLVGVAVWERDQEDIAKYSDDTGNLRNVSERSCPGGLETRIESIPLLPK